MSAVSLTLPWPPSVNHYYRHVGPRVLISKDGRRYREAVAAIARRAAIPTFRVPVEVDIGLFPPDASAWIGESGLTPFLLEMPLEVSAACTVDVKIHFRWYSASGYLYVDPGITIE